MDNLKEYSKGFYGIKPTKKFHTLKETLACISFLVLMVEILAIGILLQPVIN